MVEIVPGDGQWTQFLVAKASSLALVDTEQRRLDACRARFSGCPAVSYHLTDGGSLAFLAEATIDFAWSFDAFVHMDRPIIQGYLEELARVLVPGGAAVIHHAGQAHWPPRAVVSGAAAAGLAVISQTDRWGDQGQFAVDRYRDCITVLHRP